MDGSQKSYLLRYAAVLSLLFLFSACAKDNTGGIAINEVGYNLEDPKIAFAVNVVAEQFKIVNVQTKDTVYSGSIDTSYLKDPSSGDNVHSIHFSGMDTPGTYQIVLGDKDIQSSHFKLGNDVYREPLNKVLESFYYQRCGIAIGTNEGKWGHPACHVNDAVFYKNPQNRKDVVGGWHDAGDYNKFSITTTFSIGLLIYQFLHNPNGYVDGQLNIPGAGNKIPDILDEVRWGLEWLMKMQRSDGAVYFKVSEKKWDGEQLPHREKSKRYIFRVSSNATANFCAVAALGARAFRDYDPDFSSRLLQAAKQGWRYLSQEPVTVPLGGFSNPPEVKGGEYRDYKDTDERLWASVELYRTTGEQKYHKYYLAKFDQMKGLGNSPNSWKDVENFAHYAYLEMPANMADPSIRSQLLEDLAQFGKRLISNISENRYRYVLRNNQYYWGSNSIAMGYTFDLIQAYRFLDKPVYLEKARDQLHYILGRNPMQKSYVTNIGFDAVKNPYHQFSLLKYPENPVPGMLVGGPNNRVHKDGPIADYPAKNYEDSRKNYMVNEPAINYTATLSYVIGYFNKRSQKKVIEKRP